MDDKVYTNETISDVAFPGQSSQTVTDISQAGTATTPGKNATIPQQNLPQIIQAQELLSTALNTRTKKIIQEFQFTPSGALQIGDFENGVSGDIRISPEGIVARNNLGDITFAIDGDTGDAIFKGKIQAGSVIAGAIFSGDIILGGVNNQFGKLEIYNEFGNLAVQSTKDDFTINDTDGNPFFKVNFLDEQVFVSNIVVGGTVGAINAGAFIGGVSLLLDEGTETIDLDADQGITLLHDRPLSLYLETGGEPTPPIANGVTLYIDSSGGKNVLMCLFHTGDPQQIAIEP